MIILKHLLDRGKLILLDFILDKARKFICFILILLILSLSLSGCSKLNGKEPPNYPNSLWVSREPFVTLRVNTINRLKAYLGNEINGQEFKLYFGYGGDVDAFPMGTTLISDETILFHGRYRSYEDHLVVYIETDNLWNGQYSKLYFERIE